MDLFKFLQFCIVLTLVPILTACDKLVSAPAPTVSATAPAGQPSATPGEPRIPTPVMTPTLQGPHGTVTIWHSWNESQVLVLTAIIDDFRLNYPDVNFDVLYVPFDNLQNRYEEETRNGGGPTLLLGRALWGPALYTSGLIADLSAMADADLLDTLNPAALGSGKYASALISIPYASQGVVLYRNVKIVSTPPATFEDLVNSAKASTRGVVIGAVLERSLLYSGGHLEGLGGHLMDANGLPAFADETGVAWLELLRAFEAAGPAEYNTDKDLDLFKAGKAGFLIDGTWNIKMLVEALGAENLTIDPWPAYKNGRLAGYVQADSFFLSSMTSDNDRQAGWKFIEYVLSQKSQAALARSGWLPVRTDLELADPLVHQAVLALAGGVTYPVRPEFYFYLTPLDAALRSVLGGPTPPASALQTARDEILQNLSGVTPFPPAATPPP